MTYIMSCVWLDYMIKYFQYKNCVGSSPKTKKCAASFLVPGYRKSTTLWSSTSVLCFLIFCVIISRVSGVYSYNILKGWGLWFYPIKRF